MLSRSGTHAIRALVMLAGTPGTYSGAQMIADNTGAPRNYLGKILQQLARRGIVESQKGLGGGFRLAKKSDEITLYEIVESLEDVGRWGSCVLGEGSCDDSHRCAMHDRWRVIRDGYLEMLRTTTVRDLRTTGIPNPSLVSGHTS